jgi:alpha-ribazole phosphatase
MDTTRFWLIRHALVAAEERVALYGNRDVAVCEVTMAGQRSAYVALGQRLPPQAEWFVTPLSRTVLTARAIFEAGYPEAELTVEPGLIEQNFGALQGIENAVLHQHVRMPPHDFWPVSHEERPHQGESFGEVIDRVSAVLQRLADEHGDADLVLVCHGGVIRAALAFALGVGADAALRFSVGNISLSRLERRGLAWRVVSANETMAGVPVF